jgi:hypothetical protein
MSLFPIQISNFLFFQVFKWSGSHGNQERGREFTLNILFDSTIYHRSSHRDITSYFCSPFYTFLIFSWCVELYTFLGYNMMYWNILCGMAKWS